MTGILGGIWKLTGRKKAGAPQNMPAKQAKQPTNQPELPEQAARGHPSSHQAIKPAEISSITPAGMLRYSQEVTGQGTVYLAYVTCQGTYRLILGS